MRLITREKNLLERMMDELAKAQEEGFAPEKFILKTDEVDNLRECANKTNSLASYNVEALFRDRPYFIGVPIEIYEDDPIDIEKSKQLMLDIMDNIQEGKPVNAKRPKKK